MGDLDLDEFERPYEGFDEMDSYEQMNFAQPKNNDPFLDLLNSYTPNNANNNLNINNNNINTNYNQRLDDEFFEALNTQNNNTNNNIKKTITINDNHKQSLESNRSIEEDSIVLANGKTISMTNQPFNNNNNIDKIEPKFDKRKNRQSKLLNILDEPVVIHQNTILSKIKGDDTGGMLSLFSNLEKNIFFN